MLVTQSSARVGSEACVGARTQRSHDCFHGHIPRFRRPYLSLLRGISPYISPPYCAPCRRAGGSASHSSRSPEDQYQRLMPLVMSTWGAVSAPPSLAPTDTAWKSTVRAPLQITSSEDVPPCWRCRSSHQKYLFRIHLLPLQVSAVLPERDSRPQSAKERGPSSDSQAQTSGTCSPHHVADRQLEEGV